jgi:predicted ATP-grasp superfamily ATP-dependent carboligase
MAEFENPPHVLQNIVDGIPASVSCLSDGQRAVAIGTNEACAIECKNDMQVLQRNIVYDLVKRPLEE